MSSHRSIDDEKSADHYPALPGEYLCIDEDQASQVFDYLNGADQEVDKEMVAVHLGLCFQCQEAAAALLALDASVRERLNELKPVSA